jgi:hypothetical protein
MTTMRSTLRSPEAIDDTEITNLLSEMNATGGATHARKIRRERSGRKLRSCDPSGCIPSQSPCPRFVPV